MQSDYFTLFFPSCHSVLVLSYRRRRTAHLSFKSSGRVKFLMRTLYLAIKKYLLLRLRDMFDLNSIFLILDFYIIPLHENIDWYPRLIPEVPMSLLLPFIKVLEGPSDWEASPPNPHRLQHPRVAQLVEHHCLIKLIWHLKQASIWKKMSTLSTRDVFPPK